MDGIDPTTVSSKVHETHAFYKIDFGKSTIGITGANPR